MDHFKQITSFVNAALKGSLSAAARHEAIAPAMVGRRLDALEARLGVKLTQRTTRRLTLTPEGQSFLEDCQSILHDLETAEGAVSARSQAVTGLLRVTAPAGFGRRHVAPLIPRYAREHPRLAVTLDLSDRITDLVAEGYDCAVRFGEQADAGLVRVRLGQARRVVVAAPTYVQRHGTPRSPAELSHHQCLALSEADTPARGWLFEVGGRLVTERPAGALSCNDGAALHSWALAGMGLAWRSWWEVSEDLAAGRLLTVLRDFEAPPTAVYCVMPARKHLPLRTRLFVDLLKHEFAQPPLTAALSGEDSGNSDKKKGPRR
jgi:DNA-binding transcriptional LysR family regulator